MRYNLLKVFSILLLCALTLWFWGILSPSILQFYESVSYFPLKFQRLAEALSRPGGLAEYLSEFCVQFFRWKFAAASLVTGLLVIIQYLTWHCMKARGAKDCLFGLSFIPSFCAWAYLCVFGNLFTGVVSLATVLACMTLWFRYFPDRWLPLALMTVLLYYIAGPVSLVMPVSVLLSGIRKPLVSLPAIIVWALIPLVSSAFLMYPLRDLYLGIDYTNVPGNYPLTFFIMVFSPVLCMTIASLRIPSPHGKLGGFILVLSVLLVFAGGWFFVVGNSNPVNERILRYDRLVQEEDWDGITEIAARRSPRTIAEVSAIDLALAMKGRLLEDMLKYPQPGVSALFPDYNLGYVMSLTTDEAMFRAGMLNAARHYAYEKYESYPNYKTGARYLRRLAEIDMINGDCVTAGKYLEALSHTIVHSRWAKGVQDAFDSGRYSDIAVCRDSSEFLYNDTDDKEKVLILRRLAESGHANSVTLQYLLAFDLLSADMDSFMDDLQFIDVSSGMPSLVRQALAICAMKPEGVPQPLGQLLEEADMQSYLHFMDVAESGDTNLLRKKFGSTYWYYYNSSFANAKHKLY
ncbi:MAG: DUF6057 family protein [Candidatus Cryptobacteroides sp.]